MTPLLVPLSVGQEVTFWICAPIAVIFALGMVFSKKAVHSALCLAVVMATLSALYAALGAPFLFVAQIIVYTGAILMLFLFVVMLVGVDSEESFVETLKGHRLATTLAVLGTLGMIVFSVGGAIVTQPVGVETANGAWGGNVPSLAHLVFGDYVIAFEMTSALLITAAVGAMVMAHRERLFAKVTQRSLQRARIRRYADTGESPAPLPAPGVFARNNAINTPALLPDGSVAPTSLSSTLLDRENPADPQVLLAPTVHAFEEIEQAKRGELEQ